jgi:hypothetical protein
MKSIEPGEEPSRTRFRESSNPEGKASRKSSDFSGDVVDGLIQPKNDERESKGFEVEYREGIENREFEQFGTWCS